MQYGGFQVNEAQRIILVDVTNACMRRCTGCMRMCNHRTVSWFADMDWLRDMLNALMEFRGVVGLFGGEPLLHPCFGEIAALVRELFGEQQRSPGEVDVNEVGRIRSGIGLWTTAEPSLWAVHAEDVRRSFSFVRINDHLGPVRHYPVLVCPGDLGYTRDELDALPPCWVSRCCASSVTPWGAYFCEVAGALDGFLKLGLGESPCAGWWRTAADDQRVLCEFCGARLPLRWTDDHSVNIVSESWYRWLSAAGSKEKMSVVTQKPTASMLRQRQLLVRYTDDVHCQRRLWW